LQAKPGDHIYMVASTAQVSAVALGALRAKLAQDYFELRANDFKILWVHDFPLFEWNEEEKHCQALHHPFTSPRPEDVVLIESDPIKVKARAYDLVLNGTEIGGGSIRIHSREVQEKVSKRLESRMKKRNQNSDFF